MSGGVRGVLSRIFRRPATAPDPKPDHLILFRLPAAAGAIASTW